MTTGSFGTFSIPTGGFEGLRTGASWSGGDGKYSSDHLVKWNNYTAHKCRMNVVSGKVGWACPQGHTYFTNHEHPYYGNCGFLTPSGTEINRALNKLLEKVKGHSWNAAVDAAQLKMTADLVVGNAGKLGRAIMSLKHGDFRAAAQQLGAPKDTSQLRPSDIGGRWLELQYGWKPLLSSIYEASKAYEAITQGPRYVVFKVASGRRTERKWYSLSYLGNTAAGKQELTYGITYRAKEELSAPRSMGLYDPLSVLWEVTPYSFVADWFVPIGTYLSNLNQIPHLVGEFLVTECTTTRGMSCYWNGDPYPYCPIHGTQFSGIVVPPKIEYAETYVRRSISTELEVPPPSVNLSLTAVHGQRVGNAIALLQQRFK
jgi:hypothetical protein